MNALVSAVRTLLGASEVVERSIRKRELDDVLAQFAHDIECGTHSGIPPCCIAWFVLVRVRQDPGSPEWNAYERVLKQAMRGRHQHPGYAPCPECIKARRFTRVRRCRCKLSDDRTLAGVSADWRRRRRPLVRSRA